MPSRRRRNIVRKITEKIGRQPDKTERRKRGEPKPWDEMTEAERWAELDRLMNLSRRGDTVTHTKPGYRLRYPDGTTYEPGRGDNRTHGPNDL
jgi:hypothetical protein